MHMIRRLVVFILALVALDTVGVIEVRWAVLAAAAAEAKQVLEEWRASTAQRVWTWAAEEFRAR